MSLWPCWPWCDVHAAACNKVLAINRSPQSWDSGLQVTNCICLPLLQQNTRCMPTRALSLPWQGEVWLGRERAQRRAAIVARQEEELAARSHALDAAVLDSQRLTSALRSARADATAAHVCHTTHAARGYSIWSL